MDENQTEEPTGSGERKEFEDRLDGFADKFSKTMSDGVKKLEDAFDQGKQNLRQDMESENKKLSGSPRMGAILLAVGLVWLLATVGALDHVIFPILVIVLGIYFLIRNR